MVGGFKDDDAGVGRLQAGACKQDRALVKQVFQVAEVGLEEAGLCVCGVLDHVWARWVNEIDELSHKGSFV